MREKSSCNNWGKTLIRPRDDCLCHPLVPTQGLSHPARARRSTSGPSHYPHNTGPSFRRNENESLQLETWEGRKGRTTRARDRDVPHHDYESEEDARTSVTSLDPGTLWWRETILTTSYRLSLVDRHGIFDLGTIGNIREPSRIFPNCFPRWRRLLPKVLASLNFLGFKIWQFINIRAGNIKVFFNNLLLFENMYDLNYLKMTFGSRIFITFVKNKICDWCNFGENFVVHFV